MAVMFDPTEAEGLCVPVSPNMLNTGLQELYNGTVELMRTSILFESQGKGENCCIIDCARSIWRTLKGVFSPHASATVKDVVLIQGPVETKRLDLLKPVENPALWVSPRKIVCCCPASISADKVRTRFPVPEGPIEVELSTRKTPDEFHDVIFDAEPLMPESVILETQQNDWNSGTLEVTCTVKTIGEHGSVALLYFHKAFVLSAGWS